MNDQPSSVTVGRTGLAGAAFSPSAMEAAPGEAPEALDSSSRYRTPPAPIPQILDTPPTPTLSLSPDRRTLAFLGREAMPSIEKLAEPELRLAGTRINPRTNGPSRVFFATSLAFARLDDDTPVTVRLPPAARLSHAQWSADGTRLAFATTTESGIELWVADTRTAQARRLLGPELNATLGSPFHWSPDGASLIVQQLLPNRGAPPSSPRAPGGPLIQESSGRAAPVRTYQDLLRDPHDEELFEYYFSSRLARVPLAGGQPLALGEPGIIARFVVAPNGGYLLVSRVKRPYSYLAPLFAFANETYVIDAAGTRVHLLQDVAEVVLPPIGRDMVRTGPRNVGWRADAPATLVWAEAMDEGDARRTATVRDRVMLLNAPFTDEPVPLIELDQRYAGASWGRDDLALIHTRWATSSRTRSFVVDPSRPGSDPRLLWDRSSEDRYTDPGAPVMTLNAAGRSVLRFTPSGEGIFLTGDGASERGNYPFLDRLDLATGRAERLWQSEDPYYEYMVAMLDSEGRRFITRRESQRDLPNFFMRDTSACSLRALTNFPDPAPQLAGIRRQIITYPREDGVMLSGTLFTPAGYEAQRDGPLPLIVWAYPREFRDPSAAGQVSDSPNRFSRPSGSSQLFLLTQGYAILDGPAMPIIGEGDVEPNDSYLEQLVANARAAIERLVELGLAERHRIGVGGHSYGAFMTANLLAHSGLFRAGIARSGAYNRTLTPFGFQAEPRSYWEAQDTYLRMSPFNFVHQISAPVLLIHGAVDNNSGTFPLQSERMYQALKGHGATVRLVMLPHESHAYVARESVLHVLAEMIDWMDTYVKNAPPAAEISGAGPTAAERETA